MMENEIIDEEVDHLSVLSFDPTKVQFKINDLDAWREKDSDSHLQIGTFIKIKDGNERAIVAQIESYQTVEDSPNTDSSKSNDQKRKIVVTARPFGVLHKEMDEIHFTSGIKNISIPPQGIEMTSQKDLETMLSYKKNANSFSFGHYLADRNIAINVDGNRFFSHHVAVVGSTGSGKSGTVTKIIQNVMEHRKTQTEKKSDALNNSHIVIFDIHGEYASAFPASRVLNIGSSEKQKNSFDLWIPYWLLDSEELESLFIENGENNAYNQIAQFKMAVIANKKKWNPNISDISYDMPVYFSIKEVFEYIKNKNFECHYEEKNDVYYATKNEEKVKYEVDDYEYLFSPHDFYPTSGNSKNVDLNVKVNSKRNGFYGEFTRFITRFQARLNDTRLNFLLKEPANPNEFRNSPEKTYLSIVPYFFGAPTDELDEKKNPKIEISNITIIDLSTLPFEVVSLIVSVVSRLAFELCFYQTKLQIENRVPLMMVYEEAHRYVPKNHTSKYRDTREAIERIAKEGRKYGISEMIVTQRPSEISPTILSQCNNFVVMKLSNKDDQNIIHSILPDTDSYFTNSLSSLNRQEALLVGDAMVNTSIIFVDNANPLPQSSDVEVYSRWGEIWETFSFKNILDKMINPLKEKN